MDSDYQDLNEQERAALAALPRELAPSDLLEERVVRALKHEGHFGAASRGQKSWRRAAFRIAAAIALFAGGVATGHFASPQPTMSAPARQVSTEKPARTATSGAQSVKNNETVVAEKEVWL